MKINSTTALWLSMGFFWCIFMGVTAISIGVGAMYPPLNYIAKPFVCPNGQLSFEQNVINPIPGTTQTTAVWICTDSKSGSQTSIDAIRMSVYAGPFYGLLLFVLICFFWYMNSRWASVPIIGKNINMIGRGLGIMVLILLILFPAWPVINLFIREFAPSASQVPTSLLATPEPASVPTLLEPAADTPPTIENLARSKALHSAGGLSLDDMANELYQPADFANPGTRTYTVLVHPTVTPQWEYSWCATTSEMLAVDLKSIELTFILDGQPVPLSDFAVDESPGNNGEQCHAWFVVLDSWPVGVHHLTTTAAFTSQINDGKSDYPAGDYVQDYTVSVSR